MGGAGGTLAIGLGLLGEMGIILIARTIELVALLTTVAPQDTMGCNSAAQLMSYRNPCANPLGQPVGSVDFCTGSNCRPLFLRLKFQEVNRRYQIN